MAQIINTNITSLNSQRHLNNTNSALSRAMERLSSGKRINSAKDDAAGLGISARMTTQVRGMNQAIRNANDGISMSQTAEGALATSEEMLQRIRELAVQSSNASNASIDRQALQDEVNQLSAELNRIAQTTKFNGLNLLDGTMGAQNYQVGANAGELITSSGMNFLTDVYGDYRIEADAATVLYNDSSTTFGDTTGGPYAKAGMGVVTINGYLGSAKTNELGVKGTALDLAKEVNSKTSETGVTATARTEALLTGTDNESYVLKIGSDNEEAISVSFTIGDQTNDGYAAAINAFNAISSKTGVTAEYDQENKGIKLVHAAGNDILIANAMVGQTNTPKLDTYKADGSLNGQAKSMMAATAGTAGTDDSIRTSVIKGVVTFDSEKSFSLSAAAHSDTNLST